jgi:uncharacterized BrkB/YihY/UPF0761 family membrane protein
VSDVEGQGRVDLIAPVPAGRIERWRSTAAQAGEHYQKRAETQPLLGLPLAFVASYISRQAVLLASACAFRLFLWLMPLALLAAGILASQSGSNSASIESAAKTAGITGAASQQVITALHGGHRSWWMAVIIGAATFLWATRTLMRTLRVVNAHAWQAALPKTGQKDLVITTVMFAGGWFLVFVAVGAVARGDQYIPGGVGVVGVLQAAVLGAAWLCICLRLPDRRTTWPELIPGCVVFGAGLAILHGVSRVYLPNKIHKSSQLYGTMGIAASILVWLLLIGQIIVSSALVNSVWADYLAARHTNK